MNDCPHGLPRFLCRLCGPEIFLDGRVEMHVGDVRERLRVLPADHFDCVVTSPPYWGLRDYGTARWEGGDPDCDHRSPTMRADRNEDRAMLGGSAATNRDQLLLAHRSACGKCGAVKIDDQLGLEPTLGEHIAVMVDVFREVRRVLKPTGVCWINYGDCYATAPNGRSAAATKAIGNDDRTFRDKPFSTIGPIHGEGPRSGRTADLGNTASDGVRRNLSGPIYDPDKSQVPQTKQHKGSATIKGRIVAGGYLKSKDLCMVPERLFIALQDDGWWIRSKLPWIKRNGMPESITDRPANSLEQVALLTKSERYWYDADAVRKAASPSTNARVAQNVAAQAGSLRANGGAKTNGPMKAVVRQPGVTPKSAAEDTNIKAEGSFHASATEVLNDRNFRNTDLFFSSLDPRSHGLISDVDGTPLAIDANPMGFSEAHFATFPPALIEPLILAGCPEGGTVLDPFAGAGTTALVAVVLKRRPTLIELNPEYAVLARARIEAAFMGRDEGAAHMAKKLGKDRAAFEPGTLFAVSTDDQPQTAQEGLPVECSSSASGVPAEI